MVQMSMRNNMNENYKKALSFIERASGSDLIFFPELQLCPFFPQRAGLNADPALSRLQDARLNGIAYQARKHHMYISPNVYLEKDGMKYNASLWYDKTGKDHETAMLAHVLDQPDFHQTGYFQPAENGFVVHKTPAGNIGIVIGSDRHFPESIRACVLQGADLVIIPAANIKAEDMELYEWELRVQAMQNGVFIAMCNRTGKEGKMDFAGESLIIDPAGKILFKADDTEQLIICDMDLKQTGKVREEKPFLSHRRTEIYGREKDQ